MQRIDVVFGQHAQAIGISVPEFQSIMDGLNHRRRPATLAEVANVAAFVASDHASGITGTVINLSGGAIHD